MASFSSDDVRTLFDLDVDEDLSLLQNTDPRLLDNACLGFLDDAPEWMDFNSNAASAPAPPLLDVDLPLLDLCSSEGPCSPPYMDSLQSSAPLSPASSAPPSPPRPAKPAKAPHTLPAMMPARARFHPYAESRGGATQELRGGSGRGEELRGAPKRHRKTIQRKRQEQMARLDSLTAAQHDLRETVRMASEQVQLARHTLYTVLKTARQGGLALSRPASSMSHASAASPAPGLSPHKPQ